MVTKTLDAGQSRRGTGAMARDPLALGVLLSAALCAALAARREFGRHQNASLNGVARAVLANAGVGGAFPPRPALDDDGVIVIAGGYEEVTATPEGSAEEVEDGPQEAEGESAEEVEKALGLTRAQRVLVQRGLAELGHAVGPADGLFGRRTRAGIEAYQEEKGLAETGYLTGELAEALVALGEEAQRRAEAEEKERERLAEERRKAEEAERAEAERLAEEAKREAEEEARRLEAASKTRQVREVFRDCPECPELVVVPAGSYEGNDYGLHDVLGNVWEWTADCWNESYHGAPRNGSAWERGDCSKRVLRGGSWLIIPRYLRSADRRWITTGNRNNFSGFRIARTLTP